MKYLASRARLYLEIFNGVIKNEMNYRFSFLAKYLGTVLGQIIIVYFLWISVKQQSQSAFNGLETGHGMMLAIMASNMWRAVQGLYFHVAQDDIYNGSLNKYLLYPVSIFEFKIIQHFSLNIINLIVAIMVFLIATTIFKLPTYQFIHLNNLLLFIPAFILSSIMIFLIEIITDSLAFYFENVWSLNVMSRYLIWFCGGFMLPLKAMPPILQNILEYIPFSIVLNLPILALTEPNSIIVLNQFKIAFIWIILLAALSKFVWLRGLKNYTGVGI